MRSRRHTRCGAALLVALVAGGAWAQSPPPGRGAARPGGPTGPGMPGMAAPAPVVPDTAVITFAVPDSLPRPVALHVVQDTLDFGGPLHVVLDYAAGAEAADLPAPQPDGSWLEPVTPRPAPWPARLFGRRGPPEVDLSGLPAPEGTRVVRTYRVYRRNPLQLRWQDETTPVLFVRGRTTDAEQTAAIRDPRSLPWTPWQLIVAGLALLGLVLLALWLRRRRRGPPQLAHWPVPPPPWLAAARGLHGLLTEDHLARGETRRFLDRLAALARDYVAGRYRIAARELTGPEITRACAAAGFAPGHPAGFARLIDLADRARYNPEPPTAPFCREQAVQFFGRLARVRIESRQVPIPAADRLAADRAWAALVAELGTGAGREVQFAGPAGEAD